MPFDFKFPDVGEGITEGEIIKWLVKPGDTVKEDQIVAQVETDKAVAEIPTPQAGTVLELRAKEGETVNVGQTILVIGEKGEKTKKTPMPEKKQQSVSVVGFLEEAENIINGKKEVFAEQKKEEPQPATVKALPKTRKLAEELKISLAKITPTGKNGDITEDDVKQAARMPITSAPQKTKKYDMYGYVERIPLKGMRKTIARNMVASSTENAPVTHMDEADITQLVDIRTKEKIRAEQQGIKLTYLPFIIKALIAALKKHPYLNSSLETNEDGSQDILLKKYYNIGIGIDTPDGLMVFTVKGADQKSILDIAQELQNLAEKAKNRTIDLGDLKGGTFTITNYGSVGGIYGTPIINPGECAILGIGRILEKPLVIHGEIKIRHVLPLSLTFDHRIVDGAEAGRFANTIIEHLQDPDLMLIE